MAENICVGILTAREFYRTEFDIRIGHTVRWFILEEVFVNVDQGRVEYRGEDLLSLANVFIASFFVDFKFADRYLMTLWRYMEDNGYPLIDGFETVLLSSDKLLCASLAKKLDIKVIKTFFVCSPQNNNEKKNFELKNIIKQNFKYPFIIKPKGLLMGVGLFKIENDEQLLSVVEMYAMSELSYLVQDYIESAGTEYRLYFLQKELLFCIKRKNNVGIMSNLSKEEIEQTLIDKKDIPNIIIEGSNKFLSTANWEFCCIDWIRGVNGDFYFNEINCAPGMEDLPLTLSDTFRWQKMWLKLLKSKIV